MVALAPEVPRVLVSLVSSAVMARRGRRKQSLSKSGSIAAFFVAFASLASSVRFGMALFAFYLSGTRATKYKSQLKKKIEDGYESAGGNRDAGQVLASSLPAICVCVTYALLYRYDSAISPTFPLRSSLNLAYLLFFAACAGDTFASEIGIAMPELRSDPVLVLMPWKTVPRGTNGGISIQGTIASILGGLLIGSVYFLSGPEWSFSQLWVVVIGALGGFIGSFIDSVLGMLLQASWYDPISKKVLKHSPPKNQRQSFQHICGIDILSGEVVNALSAILTMVFAPAFLPLFRVDYSQV